MVLAVSATGIGFAACSDHTAPRPPVLSQAEADSLGDVVVASAQSELDAATASGAATFVPGAGFPGAILAPPIRCTPEISPLPPTHSDGDRVPDSVRFAFVDCVIGYRHGPDTIRGVIDIIDPTPATTDRSLRQVFIDFARIFVDRRGQVASITVNGARQVIRDSSRLAQRETDFRTDYVFGNGATANHARDWDVAFVADAAGSITRDAPLPSGTLTIAGSSTLTRDDATVFELEASTPTPLHYDAACVERPRFDRGTLGVIVTKRGATATITIEFTACGEYTVTRA
jgi:hypothetical protein